MAKPHSSQRSRATIGQPEARHWRWRARVQHRISERSADGRPPYPAPALCRQRRGRAGLANQSRLRQSRQDARLAERHRGSACVETLHFRRLSPAHGYCSIFRTSFTTSDITPISPASSGCNRASSYRYSGHGVLPQSALIFLSFNARSRNWVAIPTGFLFALLQDMFLPVAQRTGQLSCRRRPLRNIARGQGLSPASACSTVAGPRSSAYWAQRGFIRTTSPRPRAETTVRHTVRHDGARSDPDLCARHLRPGYRIVFEAFMRHALRHTDHVLTVSENTAGDVRRYTGSLQIPTPPITVTRNGSSFAEFLHGGKTPGRHAARSPGAVCTVRRHDRGPEIISWCSMSGRRMIDEGDDPPHLVCVGRLGWKSTGFISTLVESGYLRRQDPSIARHLRRGS